jgi:glycolate oxidase FAD binding subunit
LDWPPPDTSAALLGDGRFASDVDRPTSLDELRDAVRRRADEGSALYPQGGRTALDYGGIPRRPGVAVDMTGLARVIDYPSADMTITVEAGITLGALARVLDAEGQRLEIDAPEADRATVGGVFATNSTGPKRFGCGRPRDQIIGVGFVTADGNLVKGGGRVVKNVAGYDFPRLLTGSLGTLGIIVHVTMKVRPKPESSAIVVASYENLDALADDLDRLNTSSTRPVALELLNGPAGRRAGVGSAAWTLAIGFEANATSVAWQVDRVAAEVSGPVEAWVDAEASAAWGSLREFPAAEVGRVSVVAGVRPSEVVLVAQAIDSGLWALQAHAGNGIVRAHARIDDLGTIEADVHRLRGLVEGIGGYLVVARCPADRKESFNVWGHPRPDWGWSERVKAALDPGGVMNPGRFVGRI